MEVRRAFDMMQEINEISWSMIICGLAMYGHADKTFGMLL